MRITDIMRLDVKQIAVEYYFGDLQYWKLPKVALEALEEGYDGAALRRLAGLANRNANEIREGDVKADEVDSAFREMGVDAPISKGSGQTCSRYRVRIPGDQWRIGCIRHSKIYLHPTMRNEFFLYRSRPLSLNLTTIRSQ
jgi:hypothetical protein